MVRASAVVTARAAAAAAARPVRADIVPTVAELHVTITIGWSQTSSSASTTVIGMQTCVHADPSPPSPFAVYPALQIAGYMRFPWPMLKLLLGVSNAHTQHTSMAFTFSQQAVVLHVVLLWADPMAATACMQSVCAAHCHTLVIKPCEARALCV